MVGGLVGGEGAEVGERLGARGRVEGGGVVAEFGGDVEEVEGEQALGCGPGAAGVEGGEEAVPAGGDEFAAVSGAAELGQGVGGVADEAGGEGVGFAAVVGVPGDLGLCGAGLSVEDLGLVEAFEADGLAGDGLGEPGLEEVPGFEGAVPLTEAGDDGLGLLAGRGHDELVEEGVGLRVVGVRVHGGLASRVVRGGVRGPRRSGGA